MDGIERTERHTESVRIMIDIRMTNRLPVRRRIMSYSELQRLVNNLEKLCLYLEKQRQRYELDEREFIRRNARLVEERENTPGEFIYTLT